MDRRQFLLAGSATGILSSTSPRGANLPSASAAGPIDVDLQGETGAFAHNWEHCIGSDRLVVAFRQPWLREVARAHQLAGFASVRCHGMFDDDMGICPRTDASGPVTNFVYLDQIYDALLDMGVRPFVELSFMPTALASGATTVFWYRGNTSPPRNMAFWAQLIEALARHLVARYGIAEVSQWRFECWNEPNLDFWSGTQAEYFEFYRRTALALKGVNSRLRIGGPATAQMAWIPDFLAFCRSNAVPLDFISSHIYPDDPQQNVFGQANRYPAEQVIPQAVRQARAQMRLAGFDNVPLVISEWSSQNPAFIAHTINECAELAETMSFWQASSVFEEQGPATSFIAGPYGLFTQSGVPRASLHAFTLLHRLGNTHLATTGAPVLATRRSDGSSAILAWNLVPADQGGAAGNADATREPPHGGASRRLILRLRRTAAPMAQLTVVDPAKNSSEAAYAAMGEPQYPSRAQIHELRRRAALPAPQQIPIYDGIISLDLPANAVALLEVPS